MIDVIVHHFLVVVGDGCGRVIVGDCWWLRVIVSDCASFPGRLWLIVADCG